MYPSETRSAIHASIAILFLLTSTASIAAAPVGSSSTTKSGAPQHEAVAAKPKLDRSGKTRKGKASYYSHKLSGKTMANGKPMNPKRAIAASKTLPLGTVAKVTNLESGKSEVVTIVDRGPYVKGRVIDVSPTTAKKLDLTKDGVAPVEVKPLSVPKGAQNDSGKP